MHVKNMDMAASNSLLSNGVALLGTDKINKPQQGRSRDNKRITKCQWLRKECNGKEEERREKREERRGRGEPTVLACPPRHGSVRDGEGGGPDHVWPGRCPRSRLRCWGRRGET